jgi:hypothetical protein
MRFPIRSEADAFHFAVATGLLAGVAVLIGALSTPLAGLIAFVVLTVLALGAYLASADSERRRPLREAAEAPHPQSGVPGARHVLVVANEPLRGEELRARIVGGGGADARVELDVLAPVLSSRTHLAYTDIDREMSRARERLERSLSWARTQGFLAHGRIGDMSPTASIEDELRAFGADEVIVVTSTDGEDGHWQERDQLRRLRTELDVPIVQVTASTHS